MKLNIKYTLTAPLSHIGETASTGSYFQTILTSSGKIPVITANSIRGRLRDCGAAHLLNSWGIKVDKEIFHVLFSGGNLSGTMRNDIDKALKVREMFPIVSVMGGGLGDIIMAGKMNLTFAYPVCEETYGITGIESDLSWHKLIEEIEFTRTDDEKNDKLTQYIEDMKQEKQSKASTQMRYSVQYMAAGTELVQTINLVNATNVEQGAILNAFAEWFENPTLGGMASKGFGFFNADIGNGVMGVSNGYIYICPEAQCFIDQYNEYINSIDYAPHLNLLKGATKKDGKGKNKAAESDSEAD